jgi:hypothetical protein
LQLGRRKPCRPPPHARAGMAAACVHGLLMTNSLPSSLQHHCLVACVAALR